MKAIFFGILFSTLRASTPLLFAALGGMFSERSGVINIALEGLMLAGAFSGAVVTLASHSPYLGFLAAGGAGALVAFVYAYIAISRHANQVVAGTAINFLMMGTIPFLLKIIYDSSGSTPTIPVEMRFHSFPMYWIWVVLAAIYLWLRYTPSGLWVSVAGEKPEALAAAGVHVNRVRYAAVMMSGVLAGWGGACMSLFLASGYSRNMVAGRGFIALAALIFGKWRPIPTVFACLFFALTDAAQIYMQSMQTNFPLQFIQILPYFTTIIVLAGFVGRAHAPRALGTIHE